MVEGFSRVARRDDGFDGRVQILQDIASRQTQDLEASQSQIDVTPQIALGPLAHVVSHSIDLDCNPPFEAGEIQHQPAHRMMPAKFVSSGTLAQLPTDQSLREVARGALAFRGFEGAVFGLGNPSTPRRSGPVPPPVPGWYFGQHRPGTGRGTAAQRWWRGFFAHILNTPNAGRSGIGASSAAASAKPSTSRVCAGSITPSSHSRAVA